MLQDGAGEEGMSSVPPAPTFGAPLDAVPRGGWLGDALRRPPGSHQATAVGLFLPLQQVIVPQHINRTTAAGNCYFLINCILGLTEVFCAAEHSQSLEMLIETFEYVVILTAHLRRF